jgi:peptidoglycan hydrolase-like protein with peptidoglycan-binding domain
MSPTEVGLRTGDRGPAVGELQRYLSRFGYLPIDATVQQRVKRTAKFTISEVFDDETAEGLRAYQTFHGIRVTGRLDEITVGVMAVPRCGVPDIWHARDLTFGVQRFVLSGTRWNKWDLRYGFVSYSPDSTRIRINRALAAAFRAWADVTSFTFQRVPSILDDTEIRIQFAAGNHGDGSGNAFDDVGGTLAHAFYPPADGLTGGGLAGDVHFDEAETWNTAAVVPSDRFDLQSVATHEIGHALGLEHSTEPGAIMWPYFAIGTPKRSLHQDDIDGIREIYGRQTRVPHVQELRPAAAAALVRAASLNPVFTGTGGQNAWLWRQTPRAGQRVDVGSNVTMQLRNGPIP